MNTWAFLQLAIYEVLDIVPCVLLAASPFRTQIRSRKVLAVTTIVLYIAGLVRRLTSLQVEQAAPILSVVWIIFYVFAYKIVIHATLSKMLFVLIMVLNYASLVAILYSYVGYQLFDEQMIAYPYCFVASMTLLVTFVITAPFIYRMMKYWVAPLIEDKENEQVWRYLWLVPATFCVFFYYNLYTDSSILAFSSNTRNLIFAIVISAGSFFVLFLVLQLVKESNRVLQLQSDNYHLAMQTLQYEHLTHRMEETRHARHDLRQCMTVIQSYLNSGDRDNLRQFATQLCEALPSDEQVFYCWQPALNAVISYYADFAKQYGITFDAQVDYPRDANISSSDLSVLFGNLLENAVEACLRQQCGQRFIQLLVQQEGGSIVLILDNSYDAKKIDSEGQGFRSAKRQVTGIGVVSVKQIIKKYHGIIEFKNDDNVFYVSAMLPVQKDGRSF